MPNSWWDRLGRWLMLTGLSFREPRTQRAIALGAFLGYEFSERCPEDFEAIVSGTAVPVKDKPEGKIHLH